MVEDKTVRRLFVELNKQPTLSLAAEKASLNVKTARKYRDLGKLPSQLRDCNEISRSF